MITKYVTKNSNNCAKYACKRLLIFKLLPMYSMQVKLVNILTYVPILSYKYVITIP